MNKKMLTFSFDDGVTEDRRLAALFDKYGLKATFNLNSGRFGNGRYVTADEVRELYKNHEVAVHTVTHAALASLTPDEVVSQVEDDRAALEALVGYPVVGMAYPGVRGYPLYTREVMDIVRTRTAVRYARTTTHTDSFDLPENLLELKPTTHFNQDPAHLMELADRFIALETEQPALFYVWGHAYELRTEEDWTTFERFCEKIAGREDIFYGTNREVLL